MIKHICILASLFIFCACSNSIDIETDFSQGASNISIDTFSTNVKKYIPLDDTEFPYAGLPRIVIETEKHRAIKDRETEIPAQLQIWGAKNPESDVMELTIRGRGNTSWTAMPKKSYKIEFTQKQEMLGMPKDRDWALIANYADKTLMRNYLMYHLSAALGAYYAPRCEFVELFLNKEYQGVYLLTETIKISKNRVNISKDENSYIVEVDSRYNDSEPFFFSKVIEKDSVGKPFQIHYPKNPSEEVVSVIENHVQEFEKTIKKINPDEDNHLEQWIDIGEYLKHYWVQEFSRNPDGIFYTSVYFIWEKNDVIKAGPVWDFDLALGNFYKEQRNSPKEWTIKGAYWNSFLFHDPVLEKKRVEFWVNNRANFTNTLNAIDSIYGLLRNASSNNFKKWDILQSTKNPYHHRSYVTYKDAVDDLKGWIQERTDWIDGKFFLQN